MKSNFIPRREGDLYSYETNFLEKLNSYAAELGISASDLERGTTVIESHKEAFVSMNAKRADSKSATERNALKKAEAIEEMRRLTKVIRGSQKYTTEIGTAIGLIGAEIPALNQHESKPELHAIVDGMQVIIKFKKNGADGINLYSKTGNEQDFKFLSIDTASPYTDSRAKADPSKPEKREYYAFYFEDDVEVGMRSDILSIVVP